MTDLICLERPYRRWQQGEGSWRGRWSVTVAIAQVRSSGSRGREKGTDL